MRNYTEEFHANIKLLDYFLAIFHQGIFQNQTRTKNLLIRLWQLWPLWYSSLWITFYAYLILGETAGPEIVSQQILSMFCVVQLLAKQINAKCQGTRLRKLVQWCEDVYVVKLPEKYQKVVDDVFEETNSTITTCIR